MNNKLIIENIHYITKLDYLLVFLLLFISGNPFASVFTEYIYIFVVVLLMFLRKPILTIGMKSFLVLLVLLYALQFYIVRDISFPADVNHFAKIYTSFLVVLLVGYKFRFVYLKIMTFLSIVSLVGFTGNAILGQFPSIEVGRNFSIIIYNYLPMSFSGSHGLRNCGMFWEPGAFQGYIMLVFLMYMGNFRTFYMKHKHSFWILTIALITTFSTTGFIVFAFYLFLFFLGNIKKSPLMLFLTVALLSFAVWAFNHYDFLGQKIFEEYEEALEIGEGDVSWSRFGSAIIAWNNVLNHPFTGNGFKMSALYGELAEDMSGMGNGFFGAMNQLGIPFILYYLYLLFKNAPVMNNLYRWGYILLIVFLLNGEFFLNYPMFWALMFVKYPNLNIYEKNSYTPYCS